MSDAKTGYVPFGKTGAGNHGSTLGKQTMTYFNPVRYTLFSLVKSIPFPDKYSVFNIWDYGTADGAATMPIIQDLVVTLREHHDYKVQVQVIYEDQPMNDFNSLFRRLEGMISDSSSYMQHLDSVYPLASGINFRKQCVPLASMHLIIVLSSVHWLSKPIIYKESLWAYPDSTEEEKKALDQQAQKDWDLFLLLRSRELKRGGVLFIVSTGEYLDDKGVIRFSYKTFNYMLNDVWRSFRDCGKITYEEFTNTNLALCMYRLEQIKAPFADKTSTVYQSGLRLLSAEQKLVPCIFYNAWQENLEQTGVDDRLEFARNYTAAHRNWSHTMFQFGLAENRTEQEKKEIIDDAFNTIESKIAERSPDEFKDDIVFCYIMIKKE